MTNREQALLDFCREDDEEVTEFDVVSAKWGKGSIYGDNVYDTPTGQFAVLTDDEATRGFAEDLENLLADMGVEDFLKGTKNCMNFIDKQSNEWLFDEIKNFAVEYMEDIAEESGSKTGFSRQQEEIIGFLYKTENIDFNVDDVQEWEKDKGNENITEFFENYEQNLDEYIRLYAEDYADEYDGCPIEYFQDNFGDDSVNSLFKEGKISLDFEAMAEYIENVDGRGQLASYDGKEFEQEVDNESFYIFKIDNTAIEKVVDMAQELIDTYKNGKMESATVESIIDLLEDGFITREDLVNRDIDKIGQFFGYEYGEKELERTATEKNLDFLEDEYEEEEYEL